MQVPHTIHVHGPLASASGKVWSDLRSRGFSRISSVTRLHLLNHLSKWLEASGLSAAELTWARIETYLHDRREAGHKAFLTRRTLEPVYRVLVVAGLVPLPPVAPTPANRTPLDRLLDDYRDYLVGERGVAERTVETYLPIATRCLPALCGSDCDPHLIRADAVIQFAVQESRARCGQRTMTHLVLRSVLRFLHLRGQTPSDLSTAVPVFRHWRLAPLPKFLTPPQIQALLSSCDRRTRLGRRDHAVLLVLVRLGLRAGEVAALDLDDLRWREGEMVVRGKGAREDRMPLPADVGEALACYLRLGRTVPDCRALFLTLRAPHRRLWRTAVSAIVYRACRRSGQPLVHAHRLRHTAATDMLRAGASMAEIAQVLRHRHSDTTAIYAKVDHDRLRELARPWVGGAL